MELTARTLHLIRQWGAPAKFAASLALNALLPGSPVVVKLIGQALDCVHETVKDQAVPRTTGRDVAGIEKVVEVLHTDLRELVGCVESHGNSQAAATEALEKTIAQQKEIHQAGLAKLDTLVHEFDAFKKQNEELLKAQGFMGGMLEAMVPLVERLASVADLVKELNSVAYPNFVTGLRCYRNGARNLVQGKMEIANKSFERLAHDQPSSATAAVAWAASQAMNCDIDRAQKQLGRASRLKGHTDQNLEQLAENFERLSRQEVLRYRNLPDVTDSSLRTIRALAKLKVLSLWNCNNFTDEGLVHISGFTNLKQLSLRGCNQVTDVGLAHLRGLTGLLDLNLMDTRVTDQGLAYLCALRNLKTLKLIGCRGVTDAAVSTIRKLPELKNAHLQGTSISAKGLQFLLGVNLH